MAKRKSDVQIQAGRYSCRLSRKWGYFINVPWIEKWNVEEMTSYIEFLKLMIQERQKWDAEHEYSHQA